MGGPSACSVGQTTIHAIDGAEQVPRNSNARQGHSGGVSTGRLLFSRAIPLDPDRQFRRYCLSLRSWKLMRPGWPTRDGTGCTQFSEYLPVATPQDKSDVQG